MADQDRRIRVVSWATFVVVLAVMGLALYYTPQIVRGTSAAQEVQRGNEMDACRAQFRGRVHEALAVTAAAQGDLLVVLASGLAAVATDDDEGLVVAASGLPAAAAAVDEASAAAMRAAEESADAAQESADDPARFLARCRNGGVP